MKVSENFGIIGILVFDIVVVIVFMWIFIVCDYNWNCKFEKMGIVGMYLGYNVVILIVMGLGVMVFGFLIFGNMM